MEKEKIQVKHKLNEELKTIQFTKHEDVLQQLQTLTWKQKLISFWNKEMEVPLVPIGAISILLLLTFSLQDLWMETPSLKKEEKTTVKIVGNIYWKDEFEKLVINDEN